MICSKDSKIRVLTHNLLMLSVKEKDMNLFSSLENARGLLWNPVGKASLGGSLYFSRKDTRRHMLKWILKKRIR